MPLHLAGRQVEGDRRGGVEVVARAVAISLWIAALVTAIVVVGIRVADAEQDLIVGIVDRARLPAAPAPKLPRVALPRRERLRIVAAGGIECPLDGAVFRVDPEDAALNRIFATVLPDHQEIGADEGASTGEARRVLRRVDEPLLPHQFAVLFVDGHQPAVGRADIDPPVADADAARVGEERAGRYGLVEFRLEGPDALARRGIDLVNIGRVDRDIHRAVDHKRGAVHTLVLAARLEEPDGT